MTENEKKATPVQEEQKTELSRRSLFGATAAVAGAGRHDCGCEKKKCRHSNFLPDLPIHSMAVASRRGERARSQTPDNPLGVEGSGMSQSLQL